MKRLAAYMKDSILKSLATYGALILIWGFRNRAFGIRCLLYTDLLRSFYCGSLSFHADHFSSPEPDI